MSVEVYYLHNNMRKVAFVKLHQVDHTDAASLAAAVREVIGDILQIPPARLATWQVEPRLCWLYCGV